MPQILADTSTMRPGAELASVLAEIDPAQIDDDGDLLDVIAGWDRLIAWANARQLAAVADFARRPWSIGLTVDEARSKWREVGQTPRDFADDEIAARLALSPGSAGFKLDLAVMLARALPATATALEAGEIDVTKARAIADGCRFLDPATAGEVEAQVLGEAGQQTSARLKKAVRKAAIKADPIAAEQRCKTASAERGVWLTPMDDGVAELRAVMAAVDAIALHDALTAAATTAQTVAGDERTIGQLRADFLLAPFVAARASGVLDGLVPTKLAAHRGVGVNLTVPASVIMGVSNAPGELAGYGPVTAEVARVIARDGLWRRIVTNPVDGTMLCMDAETYRPPAALTRHVETRDQTCGFPGCSRQAAQCHLDHSERYPHGRTSADNLGALCPRHHRFKHALADALTHLKQPNPGTFVWTTITGHEYTKLPPALAPPVNEETPAELDYGPPPF